MADFEPRHGNRGKFFCLSFLIRLLLIALFLSVLPLFTSEAPDFISNTFFAKSWELVHLFIIGILVSYGLFARPKTQTHFQFHSSPALNTPALLHSSIFNFEHQNPSGYGNGCGNQAWEFRPYGLEPTVVVKHGTFDLDFEPLDLPVRSLRSRVEESESENFASESETEANASSCRSSIEDNESENLEENEMNSSPTPWNWPNSVENTYLSSPGVKPNAKNVSSPFSPLSSSDSESPSMDREHSWREDVPTTDVKNVNPGYSRSSSSKGSSPFSPSLSGSPTSLKSRFTKMDFSEKAANVSLPVEDQCQNFLHSHSLRSPESVSPLTGKTGNLRRESRKRHHSQSFRSPKSVSPLCNLMPPSLSEFPSLCSTVSQSQTTVIENLQREIKQVDNSCKDVKSSRSIDSGVSKEVENTKIESTSVEVKEAEPSPVAIEHERKTLSRMSHSGRFSCGSFFDRDLWRGSKGETKEVTKKGKDGKCRWDCLTLDVKPTLTKCTVKGKSVRTVRPQVITLEPSLTNENASQERVQERQDVVIISIGISEKNGKNRKDIKNERIESSFVESGKASDMEDVNEDEDYISEIDRKADEFISKFKEQIRLQKVASRRESSKHQT